MSRYTLKRISKSVYDDLVNATEDEFKKSEFLKINKDRVTNECEDVIVNGKKIEFDIDVEQINQITGSNNPNYIKNAKIAMILHKNIQDVNGTKIPYNIMNEKEVWSYLNTCIFYEQIKKLYMPKESDVTLDRIRRYYFNIASESKVSRTGFKFLWLMVDKLNSENEEEITRIVEKVFDLRPGAIIRDLDLRRPIYRQTAAYGHFGRNDLNLPWEQLNKVEEIKKYL